MYAQFISLGTTKKQLRYFLKIQGNILALRFIPLGALISILIVVILSGGRWILYDMAIVLLSGFLIFAVIKFALRKPAKLLAKTSPIEAMKFQGEKAGQGHKTLKRITPNTLAESNLKMNQKKNSMSIISLSISGTLMIALAILISFINLPAMLRQSYPLDENFQIGIQMDNFYERFPTIIQDNPLSEDLQAQIYKIPGVEKIVLDGCVVGRLVESKVVYDSPENNLETVNSLSPELVANVSELVDGTINYDEVGLDGIVVNKYRTDRSDTNYGDLKIGDTLLSEDGKVVTDESKGFGETTIQKLRDFLHPQEKPLLVPEKPQMEQWQKYYENGEYLRSAEMTEEQNYNMIDGRMNNISSAKQSKQTGKGRTSVLEKLHRKQKEIAIRSGKQQPEQVMGTDMERNRK